MKRIAYSLFVIFLLSAYQSVPQMTTQGPQTPKVEEGSIIQPTQGALMAEYADSTDKKIDWWHPAPGLSWQWHLSEPPVDTSIEANVYDIDLCC